MMLVEPINVEERADIAARLALAQPYGNPRKIWVDDGHVFVEGYDGTIVSMTPAVAIDLSRALGKAGADSLINQVMDDAEEKKSAMAKEVPLPEPALSSLAPSSSTPPPTSPKPSPQPYTATA